MAPNAHDDPPYDGGAQPVPERPPEVPTPGRAVGQYVVLIVAALVLLAGVLYVVTRLGAG